MSISKNLNINQKILIKLAKLSTVNNWQNTLNPWLRTELTYTSNSLEGNTLSAIETSIIINDHQSVAGKNMREIYEAVNHVAAWDFVQDNLISKKTQDLNEKDFLEIHSLILKDIDDTNRGKYRNVYVRIAGSNNIFPNPLKVPDLMTAVFDWLKNIDFKETETILEVAFLTHLKIVKIHPFTDGNGRNTRLFMNTILMQNGLPPLDILPENRKEYLESLETSTVENPQSFIDFCLWQYNQNLDTYLQTFN
jgi:Fic family protein